MAQPLLGMIKIVRIVPAADRDNKHAPADDGALQLLDLLLIDLQIGELAGKLSDDYVRMTKVQIDWRAIKNMRNMFAHDYGSMDIERIWETAIEDIPVLYDFCKKELL